MIDHTALATYLPGPETLPSNAVLERFLA